MSESEVATERLPEDARIDAHVSLWRQAPAGARQHASFPGEERAYLPEHLKAILDRSRFDGAVLVSAGWSEAEQQQGADWAMANPWLLGMTVGWCEEVPARAATASLLRANKLCGVWAAMPAKGDDTEPSWRQAQQWAHTLDMTLELLPMGTELAWEALPAMAASAPGRVVLADLAGAPTGNEALSAWMQAMRALAPYPQVFVKLGGLYRSPTRMWPVSQLTALFQFLLDTMGTDRLIFGSGWPYCLPSHAWKECLARFTQALGPRDQGLRAKLLGANAQRAYGISAAEPPTGKR
jgi:L-fuconolactonase